MRNRIHNDLVRYLKNGDKIELSAIRMLLGAIEKKEKEARRELSDNEIISIACKEIKGYNETLEYYKEGTENHSKLKKQIAVVSQYLPRQLTVEEVKEIINKNIGDNKNDIIKKVMPLIKGKFNSKEAIEIIECMLSKQ